MLRNAILFLVLKFLLSFLFFQGEDPLRTASTMSENIWDTLRMTLSLSGRHDLLKAVEKRDLQLINRELNDTPL